MLKAPFVSVVMPVYNVEKYLSKAVSSVLEQTYTDFELILVDDCSPDGSGKICDEFAKQDDRVQVLHLPENKGLSNARNQGLEIATGAYIFFMDSDDYIDCELFSEVTNSLLTNQAQVVMFGFVEDYYDFNNRLQQSYRVSYEQKLFNCVEDLRKEVIKIEECTLYGYACNKFYDLDYLKKIDIQFETIPLIEDVKFNVLYFMNIESLNILNITPYHYNKRLNQSLTCKFVPDYYKLHEMRVKMILDQYKDWKICTSGVKKILANIYARYIFSALQRNCDPRAKMSYTDRKSWINQLFQLELYKELIPYANSHSALLKILIFSLRHKRTLLCLSTARIIYFVKAKMPMMFNRIKQKR